MIRQIDGVDYSFTRNVYGWGVVRMATRSDRFYRSYQVFCSPGGRPLKCSCPDCVHRQSWCKHLRAVEKILEEMQSERKQ